MERKEEKETNHGVQVRIRLGSSLVVLVRSVLLALRETLVEEALAVRRPSEAGELDETEDVVLEASFVLADLLCR